MELLLPALISGTVIGAAVTAFTGLLKPLVDYWISVLTRKHNQKVAQRAVVESVVEKLRRLRVDHSEAAHERRNISYSLVLEASDAALLIADREFAKYLSVDIENAGGFGILMHWAEEMGELDGEMTASEAARSARWEHLKTLVERASEFAVTGTWDKAWAAEATRLAEQIATADAATTYR